MTRILWLLLLANSLDGLKVTQLNLVVFLMRAYKLYVNGPHAEYYADNQAILISFDVEHIKIIPYRIHRVEHLPQFIEICPVGLFGYGVPIN